MGKAKAGHMETIYQLDFMNLKNSVEFWGAQPSYATEPRIGVKWPSTNARKKQGPIQEWARAKCKISQELCAKQDLSSRWVWRLRFVVHATLGSRRKRKKRDTWEITQSSTSGRRCRPLANHSEHQRRGVSIHTCGRITDNTTVFHNGVAPHQEIIKKGESDDWV